MFFQEDFHFRLLHLIFPRFLCSNVSNLNVQNLENYSKALHLNHSAHLLLHHNDHYLIYNQAHLLIYRQTSLLLYHHYWLILHRHCRFRLHRLAHFLLLLFRLYYHYPHYIGFHPLKISLTFWNWSLLSSFMKLLRIFQNKKFWKIH